jgi:plasmid stability protein
MQYTIRGVPATVDAALRVRAQATGKSLNQVAVEALTEGAGVADTSRKRRDLVDITGSWKSEKSVDAALAAQDQVDEALWR